MDYNSLSDDDLVALSQKNYDALSDDGLLFLSQSQKPAKRKTTLAEDFGIGLHNAAAPVVKFGGMVAGAVPSYLGQTDAADTVYKKMDETLKSMEDYWVPKDAEQDFGGKAASILTTLPQQLVSFPFSPAETGKTLVDLGEDGGWNSDAQGAAALDTLGNLAGVALPGAVGGSLLKKFATGAGINAAQETYMKQAIQNIAKTEEGKKAFEPTLEGAALAAMVGGPLGAVTPSQRQPVAQPKPSVLDKTDPSMKPSGHVPSEGEMKMLEMVHRNSKDSLVNLERAMEETAQMVSEGNTSKEIIDTLTALEAEHKNISQKIAEIETILSDPSRIPESLFTDALIKEDTLLNKAKERRRANRPARGPETPIVEDDIVRMNEQQYGPIETISKETGEITRTEPKQSPVEIALLKIEQAMDMSPGALRKRQQDTVEALQSLEEHAVRDGMPGEQYNARKAAIEQEIKAYNDLLAGKRPDLSWFEGKEKPVEAVEQKQGETFEEYVQRTTSAEKPEGRRGMSDQEYSDMLSTKYGLPETVRKQHEIIDDGVIREPIELADGSLVDPALRETKQRSALQALQHAKFESTKAQRILDNINKQIAAYERGETPSGTFDVAQAIEKRTNLEQQIAKHERTIENVLRNSPEVRDKLNKEIQSTPKTEDVPQKANSVEEIPLADPVNGYLDNKHLFNNPSKTKLFFDKNIPTVLQDVFKHLSNITGLGKDQIFFVIDNRMSDVGNIEHFGNSTVVRLNRAKMDAHIKALEKENIFTKFFGKGLETAKNHYLNVRIASHELGHVLLSKYLRSTITDVKQLEALEKSFEDFQKKGKFELTSGYDMKGRKGILERQQAFHEFFAEQVAKQLMHKHILSAFTKSSSYLKSFSKMIEASVKYLKDKGIDINKQNFASDIVNNILRDNKKSLEDTGKTIFETLETENNDKLLFGNKTLEDVLNISRERGHLSTPEDRPVSFGKLTNDIAPISTRAARAIGSGATYLASKFFGKTGMAQIFKDNPVIQDVYWKIRDAETRASQISNKLWFGDVVRSAWDQSSFFVKMSKIKDGSSPYMIVKNSKPEDLAIVHDTFKKGLEDGLEYQETLDRHGANLSPEQQKIFKVLADLFSKQYEGIVKEQERMNKKNILPRRKGWYPSVRKGDYYVDISYQGSPAYREHFSTEAEGRAFLEKLGQGNLKYLTATGVEKVKLDGNESFLDTIETFKDFLEQKYPKSGGILKQDIENYVRSIVTRGGKLGKHHQHRMNLAGYKGSEVFLNDKDRGSSFKEAIQSSVNEYTGTLRKMMINHSVDPILRTGTLEQDNPNTFQVVQQMTDSALNRVENKMETIDAGIRNGVDTIAKGVYDIIGKDFKPGDPVFDKVKNNILETFYLMKLMAKPVFAVGQLMSTPVQAIRHMAYDGGIRAYWSFGKGLAKWVMNDSDLKDSMFRVSQTTNTFEPQFIEALHLNKNDNSIVEGVKKYVFLNKVNEAADSFSRALTYAAMYEHYKSLGKSPTQAERLAMQGTDATMVQYGRSEQAPIFQHAGIVGEMVRPLQTFGQAQLANIIGDIRHFETMKPSTWAPLLVYGMTASAVGGVLSVQFIQEYELLRKWLASKFPEYAPPSILDLIAHDDTALDRVLPDNETARHAMMFGLPSMSGIDLSSSVRSNETFATLIGAVLLAEENWTKMFPLISFGTDVVSGTSTLASKALGKDTTAGETAKAIQQVAPVGPVAYGAKELMGVNETQIFGDQTGNMPLGNTGDAGIERTPTDVLAGVLGTKSTNDRITTMATLQRNADDKNRQQQIKRLADLAIETGNPKYLEKIVSYNVTSAALKNMIGSELYNRLVDVDTRYILNSKGKAPATAETARKVNVLDKFRRSE